MFFVFFKEHNFHVTTVIIRFSALRLNFFLISRGTLIRGVRLIEGVHLLKIRGRGW